MVISMTSFKKKPFLRVAQFLLLTGYLFIHSFAFADFERWSIHNANSLKTIDHTPLTHILQLVDVKEQKKDLIAYSRLQGRVLDYLNAYTDFLQQISISEFSRDEQLAYWLNLHTVSVLKLIAESTSGHRRIKKFRGLPGSPGDKWVENTLTVEGEPLSLEDIEQNILARHWHDPFIIYGLCYGVKGSPSIGSNSFSGKRVHEQLETNARKFVASKKNVKQTRKGLNVSSLYAWHKDTYFAGDESAIIAHISALAPPSLKQRILPTSTIAKHHFSWRSVAYIPRQAPPDYGYSGGGS